MTSNPAQAAAKPSRPSRASWRCVAMCGTFIVLGALFLLQHYREIPPHLRVVKMGLPLALADPCAYELRCGSKREPAGCPWNFLEADATSGTFTLRDHQSCNPYERRCVCMSEWLSRQSSGDGDDSANGGHALRDICSAEIRAKSKLPTVRLQVHGWMAEEGRYPTTLTCRRSWCEASVGWIAGVQTDQTAWTGPADSNGPDAADLNLLAMTYSHEWRTPRMHLKPLAIASYESRVNYPFHNTTRYMALPDIGLSYAPHHLGEIPVQVSYNDFRPASFADPGLPWSQRKDTLLFVYGKCYDHRMAIMRAFAELLPVESAGSCAPNREVRDIAPECDGIKNRQQLNICMMRRYKFVLSIENSEEPWYSTEKLWQPLRAGTVPIYWGAPNVRDYLPHPDAIVAVNDYPNIASLVAYLKAAMADEALWRKHMVWKQGGPSDAAGPGGGWAASSWPAAFRSITQRPLHSMLCEACDAFAEHRDLMLIPAPALGEGKSVYMRACATRSLQQLLAMQPAASEQQNPMTGTDGSAPLRAYYYGGTLTQRGIRQLQQSYCAPVAIQWAAGAATAGYTAVPPSGPAEPVVAAGSDGQLPEFDYHCWTTNDVNTAMDPPKASARVVLGLLPFVAALREMVRDGLPHALFILPAEQDDRGLAPTARQAATNTVATLDADAVAEYLAVRAQVALTSADAATQQASAADHDKRSPYDPPTWHVLILTNPASTWCGRSLDRCPVKAAPSRPSILPSDAFVVSAAGAVALLQQALPLTDAGIGSEGLRFLNSAPT